MARLFCIPGAVLIFAAFILNLIVSVSLPYLPVLDVTRTHFEEGALEDAQNPMTQLRFGIWTPCYYNSEDDRTCAKLGYAYNVTVSDRGRSNEVSIAAAWTRGLAVHPVAAVVSLLATALALSEHTAVVLLATLTAWAASLLTLVAFLIDLVLFGWTKHQFKKLDVGAKTLTGPGLWLTFVAFVVLFIGGLSTCLGRIKDNRAKRFAVDAAAVEAARGKEVSNAAKAQAKEVSAAVSAAEGKAEKELEKVGSEVGAEAQAVKSGWARKFKFGKKAQA